MALTLENINLVKQRTRYEAVCPGAGMMIKALFKHLEQRRNPDLQWVLYDNTLGTDKVFADVACKIYAIYLKKPSGSTTASWFKLSNHATVAGANGDVVIELAAAAAATKEHCIVFPDGLDMSIGATGATHTSNSGNTDSSAADTPSGWILVGAQ